MDITKISSHTTESVYFTDENGNILYDGDICYIVDSLKYQSLTSCSTAIVELTQNNIKFKRSCGIQEFIIFKGSGQNYLIQCISKTRSKVFLMCLNNFEARIGGYIKKICI